MWRGTFANEISALLKVNALVSSWWSLKDAQKMHFEDRNLKNQKKQKQNGIHKQANRRLRFSLVWLIGLCRLFSSIIEPRAVAVVMLWTFLLFKSGKTIKIKPGCSRIKRHSFQLVCVVCVCVNFVRAKSFLPAKLSQQQSDGQETGEKD